MSGISAKGTVPGRHLLISSRLTPGYELTETATKHLQHLFTAWFPRAVYYDLTEDTVRVDVEVKQGNFSKKNLFSTSFLKADGSVSKVAHYDEESIVGKRCDQYDQSKTHYLGKKEGRDYRDVYYLVGGRGISRQT